MKRIFILFGFLCAHLHAFSTETLTYFVYTQSEYMQGPWTRAELLFGAHHSQYLYPNRYDELFGTVPEQLTDAILNHLVTESPTSYAFSPSATIEGDTVVIHATVAILDSQKVRNELITSFHFNGYPHLKIIEPTNSQLYTIDDVQVPFFDLNIISSDSTVHHDTDGNCNEENVNESHQCKKCNSKHYLWIGLSLLLNVALIAFLIFKQKSSTP